MNQSNLQNETSNDFFNEIEPVTHCLNICAILTFDLAKHTITKIEVQDKKLFPITIELNDLSDLNKLAKHVIKQFPVDKEKLYKSFKDLFKDLQFRHGQLHLPPEHVKLVMVVDMVNFQKPSIKHWTSLPVLGGTEDQVVDYFKGVMQLANNTLNEEEKNQLQELINKISNKMLSKV